MKGNEFHNMTDVELAEKLKELKSELFNLRFRHASGQLETPSRSERASGTSRASTPRSVRVS